VLSQISHRLKLEQQIERGRAASRSKKVNKTTAVDYENSYGTVLSGSELESVKRRKPVPSKTGVVLRNSGSSSRNGDGFYSQTSENPSTDEELQHISRPRQDG